MPSKIDHFVIGAADLSQGVAYVKDYLGVDMPFGGVHSDMGTHNHLMQLGNDIFMEVIAINPDSEPPLRPRWFGLDDPYVRQQLSIGPRLLTWVVNTDNINGFLGRPGFSFGRAELIRRGELSWYFGLPRDGRLLAGGMVPYVIEWQTHVHPSENMADRGCRFQGLKIYHSSPSWLQPVLETVGVAHLVEIEKLPENGTPFLTVSIDTPIGAKELKSL